MCISKSTDLSRKVKWLNHFTAKGGSHLHCSWGPLVYFVVVTTLITKKNVCGEVGIMTGMATMYVFGGNMGLMIHETTFVLSAPYIGCHDPNS